MKNSIISALIVLCPLVFLSQSDYSELDKKYTPQSSQKEPILGRGASNLSSVKNGLSFELMALTRGQLSFEYQRQIYFPQLVGLVSAGIPVGNDFVHRAYNAEWASGGGSSSELDYYQFFNYSRSIEARPWFQVGLRVLFDEPKDMDGRGIELRYRRQKEVFSFSNSEDFIDLSRLTGEYGVTHQTIFISYRAQVSNIPKSRFIHGVSYGLGIRTISFPLIKVVEVSDIFSNNQVAVAQGNEMTEFSNLIVLFTYSVGLAW